MDYTTKIGEELLKWLKETKFIPNVYGVVREKEIYWFFAYGIKFKVCGGLLQSDLDAAAQKPVLAYVRARSVGV